MAMNPEKSMRLFKNPLLEKLTHVHPIMPFVVWLPVVAWMFWKSVSTGLFSMKSVSSIGVIGVFSWTLFEYAAHRYLFHFNAKSSFGKRVVFLFHGIHHDQPDDASRLVMPPAASILMGSIVYLIFRMILGPTLIYPFFGGFISGYLAYDFTHYALHHFTPRTAAGRYMKQYHMLHHFVTPEARWGVTTPLWDLAFGTFPNRQTSARSTSSQT